MLIELGLILITVQTVHKNFSYVMQKIKLVILEKVQVALLGVASDFQFGLPNFLLPFFNYLLVTLDLFGLLTFTFTLLFKSHFGEIQ